ncbi:MAG: hypothetical protein AAFW74_10040 [Pseudomonadota bacterium]
MVLTDGQEDKLSVLTANLQTHKAAAQFSRYVDDGSRNDLQLMKYALRLIGKYGA